MAPRLAERMWALRVRSSCVQKEIRGPCGASGRENKVLIV